QEREDGGVRRRRERRPRRRAHPGRGLSGLCPRVSDRRTRHTGQGVCRGPKGQWASLYRQRVYREHRLQRGRVPPALHRRERDGIPMKTTGLCLVACAAATTALGCNNRYTILSVPAVSMSTPSLPTGTAAQPSGRVEAQYCTGDDPVSSKDDNIGLIDEAVA